MSTRDRILASARTLFGLHGFTRTSLRMIASDAGVDVALIAHYFGNKQGLYDAATDLPMDPQVLLAPLARAPLEDLGRTVARTFLHAWDSEAGQSMLAQLRTLLTDTPETMLTLVDSLLWRHVRERLEQEGLDRPGLRVELTLSTLIGAATLRKFAAAPEIGAVSTAELVEILAPVFQQHLTGDLPGQPPA